MPTTKVCLSVLAAGATVAGLALVGTAASSSAAPAAPALVQDAPGAFLCAIGPSGTVVNGGSPYDQNPVDDAVTARSSCDRKFVEIRDLSLSTENTTTLASGTTGTGAGKVQFDPIEFSVPVGTFTNQLFQMQASGQTLKTVLIAIPRSSAGGYLTVKLSLAFVRTMDFAYDAGEPVRVRVGLDAGALQYIFRGQDATGKPLGAPNVSGWDRTKNVSANNPAS